MKGCIRIGWKFLTASLYVGDVDGMTYMSVGREAERRNLVDQTSNGVKQLKGTMQYKSQLSISGVKVKIMKSLYLIWD